MLKSLPAGFQSTVQETGHIPDCGFYLIAVLLPAVGIEPTSRYQRTFLRRKPYTTRLPKYLSNSISTSVSEWYKASVVRRFFGTATWVRFPPPVKGLRSLSASFYVPERPCTESGRISSSLHQLRRTFAHTHTTSFYVA